MSETICCVCLKRNADIPLSASHFNNESIASKLRKVVWEVTWEDSFTICPQCLTTLNTVLEFRNACIKSRSIRLGQEETESNNECNSKHYGISSEEEIERPSEVDSERTIAVTCEICKIELNSNEHLFKHNKDSHHSEQPYKNDSISVEKNYETEKSVNDDYFCDKCQERFSSNSEYEVHAKSHMFICFHCEKPFKRKVMLAKHIKIKHEAWNVQEYENPNTDISSIQSSDENLGDKISKLFKCTKCRKTYKTKKVMMDHMSTCDGVTRHSKINFTKDLSKNKCEKCGRFYTTQKILKSHLKRCERSNILSRQEQCYMCDVLFKNSEEKYGHILDKHNINLKVDYTCQKCYKQFSDSESLQFHIEEEHKENKLKSYAERSYSCEVCSRIFGFVKDVIEHCVKEHEMDAKSVKPYLCDKCHTRFTNSTNLIQHKQYHEGERSHICSFCGKSFITKSDLTVHEYTHLNRRNYKCENCNRAFNTNKNLRSHMLVVHTDSSLWKYQCNLCEKKFPLKSGFDQHMRRHSGDKRFKCLMCEKSFISNSELKKHNRFHSSEKDHKCSYCEKEYKDRRVYEIHLAKAHGLGNAKIPVRVRKFACHICPGTFFDKQKLSRHMCTHTGIKPFVCDSCNKRFSDKSYLKYHLKVVHDIVDVQ